MEKAAVAAVTAMQTTAKSQLLEPKAIGAVGAAKGGGAKCTVGANKAGGRQGVRQGDRKKPVKKRGRVEAAAGVPDGASGDTGRGGEDSGNGGNDGNDGNDGNSDNEEIGGGKAAKKKRSEKKRSEKKHSEKKRSVGARRSARAAAAEEKDN